jgi:hypothetical protein
MFTQYIQYGNLGFVPLCRKFRSCSKYSQQYSDIKFIWYVFKFQNCVDYLRHERATIPMVLFYNSKYKISFLCVMIPAQPDADDLSVI